MTATGEVAKEILIFCCGYFLLIAIGQAIAGQTAMAALMVVGFMVPFTFVIHSYAKDKRDK